VAAFAERFTVYAVDLPGFGRLGHTKPLALPVAADVLAQLIGALGHQRISLVAHSMGGHIALLLAARYPALLERLILVSAAACWPRPTSMAELMLRAVAAGLQVPSFVPTVAWDSLQAGPMSLWCAGNELRQGDLRPLLPHIVAPTLLVWGSHDPLVSVAVGHILTMALPHNNLLVFPGAGHMPMYERAEAFNRAALAFL
jgi:pimeloyl-ACP methyl ester carboxylesterase